MSEKRFHRLEPGAAERQAAKWLARRDRGLSAVEQDDYLQWLRENPRHVALVAQGEEALNRMRRLGEWQPGYSAEPNPDLFAPARRLRRAAVAATLGAAAVLAVAGGWEWRRDLAGAEAAGRQERYLRVNERQALSDGSLVELKDGTRLDVQFSAAERRVRLSSGEARFKVAKNPARPFIVEANGVVVRAIGTIFDVRLDPVSVQVVVTEGKVRLDHVETPARSQAAGGAALTGERPTVAAGQSAVVLLNSASRPEVRGASDKQIDDLLAWRMPRLQFFETPLAEAVAEFNRHNRQRLTLGDPTLGSVRIGGTLRVNDVEGFVRLLQASLKVRAENRGADETVLTRSR